MRHPDPTIVYTTLAIFGIQLMQSTSGVEYYTVAFITFVCMFTLLAHMVKQALDRMRHRHA